MSGRESPACCVSGLVASAESGRHLVPVGRQRALEARVCGERPARASLSRGQAGLKWGCWAAWAGNRTRASRVAGENSTTEPPMHCWCPLGPRPPVSLVLGASIASPRSGLPPAPGGPRARAAGGGAWASSSSRAPWRCRPRETEGRREAVSVLPAARRNPEPGRNGRRARACPAIPSWAGRRPVAVRELRARCVRRPPALGRETVAGGARGRGCESAETYVARGWRRRRLLAGGRTGFSGGGGGAAGRGWRAPEHPPPRCQGSLWLSGGRC